MAYNWILGIGLMFGLALVFALISEREFQIGLMAFLFMFAGFMVWAGMLPEWILILMLALLVMFIYLKVKSGGGG